MPPLKPSESPVVRKSRLQPWTPAFTGSDASSLLDLSEPAEWMVEARNGRQGRPRPGSERQARGRAVRAVSRAQPECSTLREKRWRKTRLEKGTAATRTRTHGMKMN